jgi:hypothetical protein
LFSLPRPKLVTLATTTALVLSVAPAATAVTTQSDSSSGQRKASVDRRLADDRINESSGLALSNRHRNVLYTHEDSGGGSLLYAVGGRGKTRAVLDVKSAQTRDWEDMSTGPNNSLWIGDIGDNARARNTVTVYRTKEPRRLQSGKLPSTSFEFKYPDGAHDAEALLVRPRTGRLFIATKEGSGAGFYRAPKQLSSTKVNRLHRRMSVPTKITAGAFEPKGGGFVVRNHNFAWIYDNIHTKPQKVKLPDMPQGESIEFTQRGRNLLAGSERRNSLVWSVPRN